MGMESLTKMKNILKNKIKQLFCKHEFIIHEEDINGNIAYMFCGVCNYEFPKSRYTKMLNKFKKWEEKMNEKIKR